MEWGNRHKHFLQYWLYRNLFSSSIFFFSLLNILFSQTEALKRMTLIMWCSFCHFYLVSKARFSHALANLTIIHYCFVWVLSNVWHLQFCEQKWEELSSFWKNRFKAQSLSQLHVIPNFLPLNFKGDILLNIHSAFVYNESIQTSKSQKGNQTP